MACGCIIVQQLSDNGYAGGSRVIQWATASVVSAARRQHAGCSSGYDKCTYRKTRMKGLLCQPGGDLASCGRCGPLWVRGLCAAGWLAW